MPNNLEILSLCIIFLYTFQELFLLFQFKLIPPTANLSNKQFKLSVIISSKNEAENLIKNLPSILTQNHPDYEVIIVDDQSNDDTFQVIQDFQKNHSHLKYFKIDNYKKSSKKNALSCGIRVAKNENLVFTDADCKPKTNQWLSELQGYFGRKDTIILGYSPYSKEKSWLNNLIRFETFQTAVNYFGMAKMGQAYMGVGRNLAYTKTIFNSLGQFNSHQKIASGDDDLFINEASGRFPIHCCINPKTFVESKPKGNWKAWINQKRRHITTASHYKLKHQFWLSFQFVLRFLFWFWVIPVSVMALSLDDYPIIFITLTLLTIKLLVSRITFINLDAKDLWLKSLVLEFHLICLQLYIFSLNLVSPKRNW